MTLAMIYLPDHFRSLFRAVAACLLFSFSCSSGYAQWSQMNQGLFGGTTLSLAAFGDTIFVGTDHQGIYRSTDNGAAWKAVNNGLKRGAFIPAVVIKGNKIYAADFMNGVFVSENNGDSWTAMNYGLPANVVVLSLVFQGNDLFAGTKAGIFVNHAGTNSWSTVGSVGLPPNPIEIPALGVSGDYLLAGIDYGKIFRSNDTGETWTETTGPLEAFTSVRSFAKIAGKTYACTSSGLLVSIDDGGTWSLVTNGLVPDVTAIITDGTSLLASTNAGISLSTDNGVSWNDSNPASGILELLPLIFNNGRVIGGGIKKGLYYSEDFGSTWNTTNEGFTAVAVQTLFRNDTSLFAGTDQGIFLSSDSGASWNPRNFGLSNYSKSTTDFYFDGSKLFASSDAASIHASTNNGTSWSLAGTGLTSDQIYDLLPIGGYLFAATGKGVFRYSTQSSSWTSFSTGLPQNPIVSSLGVTGSRMVATVFQHGVYVSDDGGVSWTNVGIEPIYFFSHRFTTKSDSIFSAANEGIFLSKDNGNNWDEIDTGSDNFFNDVIFFDNYFFAGGIDGVFFSADQGKSWASASEGFPSIAAATCFHVIDTLLLAGTTEGVWTIPLSDFYPVILALSDTSASPGEVIEIAGKNFSSASANLVTFNGTTAIVVSASPTSLKVKVPNNATSGPVTVTVNEKTAVSNVDFCVAPPVPSIKATKLTIPTTLAANTSLGIQWFFNGLPIAGATDSTLSVNEPGTYTATASAGCTSGMSNSVEVVITGLESLPLQVIKQVALYPNPGSASVTLDFHDLNKQENIQIEVYSVTGECVAHFETTSRSNPALDISAYSNGLYFVVARQTGASWMGKFFKK